MACRAGGARPMYARFPPHCRSRDERTLLPAVDDWGTVARRRRRRSTASRRKKNALQLLNELRPGLEYRVVSQTGPCHRPVFTVHVQLAQQVRERDDDNEAIVDSRLRSGPRCAPHDEYFCGLHC